LLATFQFLARSHPANDPARNLAGDLADDHAAMRYRRFLDPHMHFLVFAGRGWQQGVQKLASMVSQADDFRRHRGPVDVDVEHAEEDPD